MKFKGLYARNQLYECALHGLDVKGFTEIYRTRTRGTNKGKKMLVRAIGKAATISLGWVGTAWIAADFEACFWR